MKNIWKWIAIFLAVLIVASFVFLFLRMSGFGMPFGYGMNGYGMGYGRMPLMGGDFRGSHMFNGYGFFGGGFMMFGALLIPLAVIGLLVWGVVSLVKGTTRQHGEPPTAVHPCTHCGKPLQSGWVNCPYCGEKI
jgi:hypothetical protein